MTELIRRVVPRALRNALRRPRVTTRRIFARAQNLLGFRSHVEVASGWSVTCHPICVPEFSVFKTDQTQCAELKQFLTECTDGMRLLDVGAHWGVFTLAALHFGGGDARSVCVEASSAAAKVLKRNLALNGFSSRATVVEAAAGAVDGELEMLTTGAGGADYLVVPAEPRVDTRRVRQVRLTTLCERLEFKPSHLKIDIEGFEEEGLNGARELILSCRPRLFLELHGELIRKRHREPQAVLSFLRRVGYEHWFEDAAAVDETALASRGFNARLLCMPL